MGAKIVQSVLAAALPVPNGREEKEGGGEEKERGEGPPPKLGRRCRLPQPPARNPSLSTWRSSNRYFFLVFFLYFVLILSVCQAGSNRYRLCG